MLLILAVAVGIWIARRRGQEQEGKERYDS